MLLLVCTPQVGRSGVRWETYFAGQGLPSSSVISSAVDSSGAVWFGTGAGLVRFDGLTWQLHSTANGLPGDVIQHVTVGADGRVWVSTPTGAAVSSDAGWQKFTMSDGLPSDAVNVVLPLGADGVYFGTMNGLALLRDGVWTIYQKGDQSPIEVAGLWDNRIQSLARDRNRDIWVGQFTGYNRLIVDGRIYVDDLRNRVDTRISGIAEFFRPQFHREHDRVHPIQPWSILLATSTQGLKIYDGTWMLTASLQRPGLVPDIRLPTERLNTVLQDSRQHLWLGGIGDPGAVLRFDGAGWTSFGSKEGFLGFTVSSILEDSSGQLWFGTYSSGLYRFDGELWTTLADPDTFTVTDAVSLAEGPNGDIWLGGTGGVDQWNERWWKRWGPGQGIAPGMIQAIWIDPDSTVWLGSGDFGAAYISPRFGVVPITQAQGIPGISVTAIRRTGDGRLWFGTNISGLAEWGDEQVARIWTTADGLPSDWIRALAEDGDGRLWCATVMGIAYLEAGRFHPIPGQADHEWNDVADICFARDGSLWCATRRGAARFRDGSWTLYAEVEGLPVRRLTSVTEDPAGRIWFGTERDGVIRFDGVRFRNLRPSDGLAGDMVKDVLVDRRGRIWVACRTDGLTVHELDHGAPRAIVRTSQEGLGTSRFLRGTLDHAFDERWSVAYSWRVNGGAWSPWSESTAWDFAAGTDGRYLAEFRARDENGNIDRIPSRVEFEIDATPPNAVIESPVFGQAVRGRIAVRGSAHDPRFESYRLEMRPAGEETWAPLATSGRPVAGDVLAEWDTGPHPDGRYELRLAVLDTLNLEGFARIDVVVDNEFPDVEQTAPATIGAERGGDVYTEDGSVHLHIAPRALDRDAMIRIVPLDEAGSEVRVGAPRRLSPVLRIDWRPAELGKPARLGFGLAGIPPDERGRVTAMTRDGSGAWHALGGTLTPDGAELAVPLAEPVEIALFERDGTPPPSDSARLSGLSITPRVLDVARGAPGPLVLSFRLSEPATLGARVYTLSGLLVRVIESDRLLPAGEHLIEWDGRTDDGSWPHDGPYVIALQVNDETLTKSVVVRR